MENATSFVEYVLRSGARTDVLLAIADGHDSTQVLLDREIASESAVYNALTELENRGLIYTPRTKHWATTGIGSLVGELIERQQETERILQTDVDYWQFHDVTVLPEPFRCRLADLDGGTVVRASDTHPAQAIREVERRLKATDSASVIAPIFNERYSKALTANSSDARLILGESVLADLLADADANAEENQHENLTVRVADVAFAVAVTEDSLLLSLPLLDGSYDAQTEFVVESERARSWGAELFEHVWTNATCVTDYVESLGKNVR